MEAAVFAPHGHDAAVAAAHPAAHHAFDGHLTGAVVARCGLGARGQHPLGSACVEHDRNTSIAPSEGTIEWRDDAAALAAAAVLGRQDERDPELLEVVQVK